MRSFIYVLLGIAGLLVGLFVILSLTGIVHSWRVPTGAMKPTIVPGDIIYTENLSYRFRKPRRGEIITFATEGILGIPQPEPPEQAVVYIKRVIGLPGDKLELRNEHLFVNGKEDAAASGGFRIVPGRMYLSNDGLPVQVPANSYFAVGDNTDNSYDSRYWGFVPANNLKGRVVWRCWPPSRFGPL
jgi:signal peptidase I